jgi:hypothetical protein
MADELGVTVPVVVWLMRREGVPGLRGVSVAKAHQPPEPPVVNPPGQQYDHSGSASAEVV